MSGTNLARAGSVRGKRSLGTEAGSGETGLEGCREFFEALLIPAESSPPGPCGCLLPLLTLW